MTGRRPPPAGFAQGWQLQHAMGIVPAMKQHTFRLHHGLGSLALLLALSPLVGAATPPAAPAAAGAPATDAKAGSAPPAISNEQAGYLFGLTFGEQLHGIGVTDQISSKDIARGIQDALQGKKSTPADKQQVQEFARSLITAQQARNQKAAQDFLGANRAKPDVKTTASGLQYKVMSPGDAKAPAIAATDQVTVNYRGTLIDGSEFDSSYARGQPAQLVAANLIQGWREALLLMSPGAKWRLFVPPELAYGAKPPTPAIPPNALLVFDVDLVSIDPPNSVPATAAR